MIGQRIRQARLLGGLTQTEVAEKLTTAGFSATKAVISKYELNKSVPRQAMLLKLAELLEVPVHYFVYEAPVSIRWIAYRKHQSFSKETQTLVEGYAQDVVALHQELHTLLYPNHIYKLFPLTQHVSSYEAAEAAAQELRSRWFHDSLPLENLTTLAEDQGLILLEWKRDAGSFDGLAGWADTVPVIVSNLQVATDRRRFNLAHELGHLFMETPDEASEELVNRFAAAFIVPKSAAYRELGRRRTAISLEEFGILKQRYGLSIHAWIRRAAELEIISDHLAQTLRQELNQRGWSEDEPYKYVADEAPKLRDQMILHALTENLISVQRIRQALPKYDFQYPITQRAFPTPAQLLAMSPEERQKWMQQSFEQASQEQFETFDAFGEEEF